MTALINTFATQHSGKCQCGTMSLEIFCWDIINTPGHMLKFQNDSKASRTVRENGKFFVTPLSYDSQKRPEHLRKPNQI